MELDISKRVRDVSDRLGYGRDKRHDLFNPFIFKNL